MRSGISAPSKRDRLVRITGGEVDAFQIATELRCAADTVAVMVACYAVNDQKRWVDVETL